MINGDHLYHNPLSEISPDWHCKRLRMIVPKLSQWGWYPVKKHSQFTEKIESWVAVPICLQRTVVGRIEPRKLLSGSMFVLGECPWQIRAITRDGWHGGDWWTTHHMWPALVWTSTLSSAMRSPAKTDWPSPPSLHPFHFWSICRSDHELHWTVRRLDNSFLSLSNDHLTRTSSSDWNSSLECWFFSN